MSKTLETVCFPALRTDTLGNYLAALGLLRACTTKWPRLRGLWDNGEFVLAAEGLSREVLREFVLKQWQPTRYERWWKGNKEIARARSWQPDIRLVRLLDAHIVARRDRNVYNDILGTGGNVGKRDFSKVAEECGKLVSDARSDIWLDQALFGWQQAELPDLPSTGTWFANANKAFNSGLSVAREGKLSPWSYLLALEGALMLRGGVGKRLGGRARPYATFPFISEAAPPENANDLSKERSEFWAPIWDRPATLEEVRSAFRRGQARVGSRAARAPYDFAVAAMTAGTQAGFSKFARFALRQTTSSNTYEAIPSGVAAVHGKQTTLGTTLVRIADWANTLPADQATKQKEIYYGLRGPINRALLQLAQEPDGGQDQWRKLLRAIAEVEFRVDRNRLWRKHSRSAPLLPEEMLSKAWPASMSKEVQIACSIASVRYRKYKLRHNLFGIDRERPERFADERPASVVWHGGQPERALADVLERRLIDAKAAPGEATARPPLRAARPCSLDHLDAFAAGRVDVKQIADLVPVLSLIAWGKNIEMEEEQYKGGSPEFLLQGFFRPLLMPYSFKLRKGTDPIQPDAVRARAIVRMIRGQMWKQAFDLGEQSYRACGIGIVRQWPQMETPGDRIAASLLIPVTPAATRAVFRRWVKP